MSQRKKIKLIITQMARQKGKVTIKPREVGAEGGKGKGKNKERKKKTKI